MIIKYFTNQIYKTPYLHIVINITHSPPLGTRYPLPTHLLVVVSKSLK